MGVTHADKCQCHGSESQDGVFRWVGEAYGKKFGFLAIFLQWVESTIWYPTVLTFG